MSVTNIANVGGSRILTTRNGDMLVVPIFGECAWEVCGDVKIIGVVKHFPSTKRYSHYKEAGLQVSNPTFSLFHGGNHEQNATPSSSK